MKWFRGQSEHVPAMTAFKNGLRSARNEGGQALVLTALSMTVLLGFMALATDAGVMLRQKRIAQSVADSAAIAGAFEALYEGTPSTVTTGMWNAAAKDATLNGYAPGSASGVLNSANGVTLALSVSPNIGVSGFNSAGYVQAIVTFNTPTFFMSLFHFPTINVTAAAIASDQLQASGCFDVQNGGNYADPAGTMGGSSEVFGTSCGVTINGNVDMGGHANIDAKYVAASGTIQNQGSSSITGTEVQNAPPTNDPLPQLQQAANQPTIDTVHHTCTAPASATGMSCIYDGNTSGTNGALNGTLSGTLQANTIYVFDGAVNSGNGPTISGNVTGASVTLYLAGNTPFDFANNGTLSLSPPGYQTSCLLSTNPFCGILIDAPSDGSNNNGTYTCSHGKGNNYGNPGEIYLNFGSSSTTLNGVIYAPYMQLFVQDQGSNTTMNNDVIIGNFCAQSATITINGYSPSYSPVARIGLVY
ncbi:pilus assembly protein TadG-related protein [Telmatobacter sp. DSM 110680]|uniref:Pilus assembly protein TadG-related protein n=1 Tax=Telmatobacter sp. DSM 110680 TaxID=3036704 RepID=A0AAU7DKF9_9BACT